MNWNDWIIHNELIVKLTVFWGVFFLMAAWEQLAPCRALTISKSLRWINLDSSVRSLQWTKRVEGSRGVVNFSVLSQ